MKSDQVASMARTAQLRHSEGRPAVQHNSGVSKDEPLYVGTFALLAQPPFHHTTACPTKPSGEGPTRRSSDRKRASAALRVEERHDCRGTNAVWAWGSPPWVERAPRKFGWWGAKQVEAKKSPLTVSAFSFPQFTHILSRIFFTLTINPTHENWNDRKIRSHATHLDGISVSPVQCDRNVPGTPTLTLHKSDI
jgi:hypothetical protein